MHLVGGAARAEKESPEKNPDGFLKGFPYRSAPGSPLSSDTVCHYNIY